MIPRVLHHVWLGNRPIPDRFIEWRRGWRWLHPHWRYRLWTDESVPPDLAPLLRETKSLSSAANIVRLHAVHACGGVYADLDFEWNRNIDHLLGAAAFAAEEEPGQYCNAFFGATAGHEWVRYQLGLLPEYADARPPWGPELMTRAAAECGGDLTSVPTEWVYPYSWREDALRRANEFPDALLVHHWDKSWRAP